ncbi:MAG: hypothetical protein C4532_05125 [Candidatus Abyssobacteria bacterium SURF_17]|uniref:Uncharacterized protein n=1 Tax=Candidatus Abyssobacteria bacterium SURF_17 TaxID=2093361 RepID=A0A419F390_9BACT|nr:MAG: hypothetical protein C4532_05125 [Candidatus Abyssubacteria bacterium SURF_17]
MRGKLVGMMLSPRFSAQGRRRRRFAFNLTELKRKNQVLVQSQRLRLQNPAIIGGKCTFSQNRQGGQTEQPLVELCQTLSWGLEAGFSVCEARISIDAPPLNANLELLARKGVLAVHAFFTNHNAGCAPGSIQLFREMWRA